MCLLFQLRSDVVSSEQKFSEIHTSLISWILNWGGCAPNCTLKTPERSKIGKPGNVFCFVVSQG